MMFLFPRWDAFVPWRVTFWTPQTIQLPLVFRIHPPPRPVTTRTIISLVGNPNRNLLLKSLESWADCKSPFHHPFCCLCWRNRKVWKIWRSCCPTVWGGGWWVREVCWWWGGYNNNNTVPRKKRTLKFPFELAFFTGFMLILGSPKVCPCGCGCVCCSCSCCCV